MGKPVREPETSGGALAPPARQRLDKWLWFARVVKSRTLAAKLVSEGHVRINAQRVDTPAKAVGPGDVLTVSLEWQVKVLKVLSGGARRGPYEEARQLYEDLSEVAPDRKPEPGAGVRERGSGRPTKRDRRMLSAWVGRD